MFTGTGRKVGWIKGQTLVEVDTSLSIFVPFSIFVIINSFTYYNVFSLFSFFRAGQHHDAIVGWMNSPFARRVFYPDSGNQAIVVQVFKRIFVEFSIAVIVGGSRICTSFVFHLCEILLRRVGTNIGKKIKRSGIEQILDTVLLCSLQ